MKASSSSSSSSWLLLGRLLLWWRWLTLGLFFLASNGLAFAPSSSSSSSHQHGWCGRTPPTTNAGRWATVDSGVGRTRSTGTARRQSLGGGQGAVPPTVGGWRRQKPSRRERRAATTILLGAASSAHAGGVSTTNATDGAATEVEDHVTSSPSSYATQQREVMPWTLNVAEHGSFDQEDWAWAYSTVPPEAVCASYPCTNVQGTIPRDLKGTYYKIGPANFERGGRRFSHVLDGDGFVTSFRLDKGQCTYAGRFVETEMFLKERQYNDVLYRNVFGTQRDGGMFTNAFDVKLKNVANTNVLMWGGRMFALWEGGRPYELDPSTLAVVPPTGDGPFHDLGHSDSTRGITVDEGGPIDSMLGLGRSFTAHPHVVDNGETLVALRFGQNPSTKELKMEFVEYDNHWQVRSATKYGVPDTPAAPHDMSVTSNYYGFVQNRFDLDNVPFLLGIKSPTQVMQVPLHEPARLHLVPRPQRTPSSLSSSDDPNVASPEAIVVDIPNYFCIHNLGRMEESDDGTTLTLYTNGWNLNDARYFPEHQDSVPFLGSWGGRCPDFANQVVPPSMLYRTIVDLKTHQLISHEEVVPGLVIEFPTQEEVIDDNDGETVSRLQTDPHSIYCSIASSEYTSMPGTGHCKVDTKRDRVEFWWANPKTFTGEMTAVPKRNGESGSWLLTVLYDAQHKRASLGILDSVQFQQGPVATIHLPFALAYGLHGTFVEENG